MTAEQEVDAPPADRAEALARLRAPFESEAIGKLPRSTCQQCSKNQGTCNRHPQKFRCQVCGNWHSDSTMHIDYVGHADVTARLLAVDPGWSWEPFTPEQLQAIPPRMRDAGLWINLTVLGVTRPGFGDADGKTGGNAVKEAIGDALRNGAMRFGVALDLWAKGDRDWANAEKDGAEHAHPDQPGPRQDQADTNRRPSPAVTTADLLTEVDRRAQNAGDTYAEALRPFIEGTEGVTIDNVDSIEVGRLQPYVEHLRSVGYGDAQRQPAGTDDGADAAAREDRNG